MRCLVTGANGLLGSHLCRALRRAGHEVRALVRKTSDTRTIDRLGVDKVAGDVREPAALRRACEGVELVFHCAAVFSYWGYSKREMYATAEVGMQNAVDAAKDAGARRMVLTSSTAVLGGSPTPSPLHELSKAQLRGSPDYFISKSIQEKTAFSRGRERGLEVVAANPSIFVGPYDLRGSQGLATITGYVKAPLLSSFAGGCNVVHAADVAQAHLLLAEKGTPFERHIIAGENCTWEAVHRLLSELLGLPPPKLVAGRGAAWLAGAAMELVSLVSRRPPLATRKLSQQVGRYFWYEQQKLDDLGFACRGTREVLTDVLGWLLTSTLLTEGEKRRCKPVPEVEAARQRYAAAPEPFTA